MNVAANRQITGENWGRYVDTTEGLVFGNWQSIVAVSASTINIAASNTSGNTSSVSLLAGQEIRGRFTSLTVVSGAVICRSSVWQQGPGGLYPTKSDFSYDDYVDMSSFGPNGTFPITNGISVSSNLGKTITFTYTQAFTQMAVQGISFLGYFENGDFVIDSRSNNNILTFSSSVAVKGFGIEMQGSDVGKFIGIARFLNSSNDAIATDMGFGLSTLESQQKAPQMPLFLGYQAGSSIVSKIELKAIQSPRNRFGINRLLIKS